MITAKINDTYTPADESMPERFMPGIYEGVNGGFIVLASRIHTIHKNAKTARGIIVTYICESNGDDTESLNELEDIFMECFPGAVSVPLTKEEFDGFFKKPTRPMSITIEQDTLEALE